MANTKKGDHRLSSIVITNKQKDYMDQRQELTGESYNAIVRSLIVKAMTEYDAAEKANGREK